MPFLRKIATGLLVIVISSVIFFLLVSDRKTKKEVLRPTLEALGEKLFAAVQPDSAKDDLQRDYQDFVKQAEAKEIKPEEIEKIAADILNLSIRDSMISSKDARKILAFREKTPPLPLSHDDMTARDPSAPKTVPWGKRLKPPLYEMNEEELAERLQKMHEVERKLQHITINIKREKNALPHDYLVFKADSGLVVKVDMEVKKLLQEKDRLLAQQLSELEKKKWLQWQDAMKEKQAQIEAKNDSLHKKQMQSEPSHEKKLRTEYYFSYPHKREQR